MFVAHLPIHFRFLGADEETLLWPFLMLAAHEETVEAVRHHPQIALYVAGWGRKGDIGIVAHDTNGENVGAAWLRLWTLETHGFVWINESTPELSMAVAPLWRGRGVGTELLRQLLALTDTQFETLALNVRVENPAVQLYRRAGFERRAGSEIINRTGGVSFSMVRRRATQGR